MYISYYEIHIDVICLELPIGSRVSIKHLFLVSFMSMIELSRRAHNYMLTHAIEL